MTVESVGDMTVQELRSMIEAVVDERIRPGHPRPYRQTSDRPIGEVLQSMRENIWTPPPGTPSIVEMLREDRDR